MQTYEFVTITEDGMIKIPSEYVEEIDGEVKVIVLTEKKKL